jgi:DNA mismatch repair protein MutL
MSINILPEKIINQIAAGEVIENPSGVIKELVENSIDANSTKIDIEIEDSGLKKIVIKDNGKGIPKDDLLKAPLRHATSKITSFNDLYSIRTMGFRGEALASIFSVAKAKIISKTNEQENAFEISSDNIKQIKLSGRENGTTIIVEDLFYNTAARKKYLKSEIIELKNILDVLKRFQISYPELNITLKHNGRLLFTKPFFDSYMNNLIYIWGQEYNNKLVEFREQENGIRVYGLIGKPSEMTFPYKKNQYIFINGRYVRSKLLTRALYEGFGTNLMVGRHPVFTLFVDIDPEIVDVNIHPTKIEVRFENELEMFDFVKKSIEKIFQNQTLFVEVKDEKKESDIQLDNFDVNVSEKKPEPKKEEKSYFSIERQYTMKFCEENQEYKKPKKTSLSDQTPVTEKGPLYDKLETYRIVGQVYKTYIIVETPNEMFLIDQHAAEEKCNFEKYRKEFEEDNIKTQTLLKPEVVKLSQEEFLAFQENKHIFKLIGIIVEEFGNSEVVIRALPLDINSKMLDKKFFMDILYLASENKNLSEFNEISLNKIATLACRSSIKAGYEMQDHEIKKLIERLKTIKEPFNCPHGRPTIIRYSFEELEKMFKRIV